MAVVENMAAVEEKAKDEALAALVVSVLITTHMAVEDGADLVVAASAC